MDAAFGGGIDLETSFWNRDITVEAATIMALCETIERRNESPTLLLTTGGTRAGHGLSLQGIHARQAPDPTLIEHHSGLGIRSRSIDFVEFHETREQARTGEIELRHRG